MFEIYAFIGSLVVTGMLLAIMALAIVISYECVTDIKHFGYVTVSRNYVFIAIACWVVSVGGLYLMTL